MDDDDDDGVSGFFKYSGTIELICIIDREHGTPVTEIKDRSTVSGTTMQKRMRKAREFGLIESTRTAEGHGNIKRQIFTEKGESVREALEVMGTVEACKQLMEADPKKERGREVLRKYVDAMMEQPNVVEYIHDELREASSAKDHQDTATDNGSSDN